MDEKGDIMSAVESNKDSPSNLMSEIQKLRSEILDDRERTKNTNDQKLEDILEKLQSIEDWISNKKLPENKLEEPDAVAPCVVSSCLPLNNPIGNIPGIAKSFVLKHVFENVENFEINKGNFSEKEDHFGFKWRISLVHKDDHLQFYLHVDHPNEGWEIETKFDFKIVGTTTTNISKTTEYRFTESIGFGYHKFLKWEEVKKNYLVDGNLNAEIHVKIIETKGLRKEKFRSFDESVKEVSDMVLVVKDRKFYVNKTFLAAQSSFFKALLLGSLSESRKSEVTLTGIDPEDFHFFLEVLYGEAAFDENTVEGIALLADMYDAPTAIRRCEEFMLNNSKKNLKRKLQMADQYHLGALKKMCLAEIRTSSDLRSVVPNNVRDLEHSTVVAILEKAISVDA